MRVKYLKNLTAAGGGGGGGVRGTGSRARLWVLPLGSPRPGQSFVSGKGSFSPHSVPDGECNNPSPLPLPCSKEFES